MTPVVWHRAVPELARLAVESAVMEFLPLLPSWVQELRVLWDDSQSEYSAHMHVHFDYRFAQLVLTPNILTTDEETRNGNIRHEMIHAPLMPMKHAFHALLDSLNLVEKNPELYGWAFKAMEEANEGAVQDLTIGIANILAART